MKIDYSVQCFLKTKLQMNDMHTDERKECDYCRFQLNEYQRLEKLWPFLLRFWLFDLNNAIRNKYIMWRWYHLSNRISETNIGSCNHFLNKTESQSSNVVSYLPRNSDSIQALARIWLFRYVETSLVFRWQCQSWETFQQINMATHTSLSIYYFGMNRKTFTWNLHQCIMLFTRKKFWNVLWTKINNNIAHKF